MTVTKQQVIAALAELRINRPRRAADRHILRLLQTYGNGATNISELSAELYEKVWRAAGGSVSYEDFYGVALDVPMINATKPAKITITPLDVKRGDAPSPSTGRIRSPLVAELESRLAAAKAKTKRSVPGGRVNLGNASRSEDQADDVVRDFPSGEKMS